MQLLRKPNETEEQYIWRLGNAKDTGEIELSWNEIADLINQQFREDESEYVTEAAYRKPYQQARRFYEAGIFNNQSNTDCLEQMKRERVKLSDERCALNKNIRERARFENDVEYLTGLIQQNGFANLPEVESKPKIISDSDMVICLSDLHIGIEYDNEFGKYNSKIAAERLAKYLKSIEDIQREAKCKDAYVLLLGDICSGNIHMTIQLENRQHVVQQVKYASELIASFINELSGIFNVVHVNSVAGNHSRVGLKQNVLRDERLDDLIPWYVSAALSHVQNVHFESSMNLDPTIAYMFIQGKPYIAVHGDYDSFDFQGVSKLAMMINRWPEAVFMGHTHKNGMEMAGRVKVIRSGSLSGSGDDYCVQKRISGMPCQMVTIVDYDGIKTLYPVSL